MKNRIESTEEKKAQKEALATALAEEKTQGSALRQLKTLSNLYDFFTLSDFQTAVLNNQDNFFKTVKSVYTKSQKRKVEQLRRIKEGEPLLMRESFSVVQKVKGTENTLKTFGTRAKAKAYIAEHPATGSSIVSLNIEKKETPISTSFTPNEMLSRLQYLESAFYGMFPKADKVTVAMLNSSIGKQNTKKDKALSAPKKATKAKAKKAKKVA